MMKSWKAEIKADSTGKWYSNMLRFQTREEAEVYGQDLAIRWTAVQDWRAVESEEPPTEGSTL